jgi:uncharacterized ParB-like nuclease family protein
VKRLALIIICIVSAACSPSASGLSSHTVQVGPAEEVDVIWIQKAGQVYRCTGKGERPVCERVAAD